MARNLLFVAILVAVGIAVTSAAPRKRRVTEEEATPLDRLNSTSVVICNADTSCGWTVYTPFTKDVEYYMKNNYCECAHGTECSYYDDDISIGSYVHRCQAISTTKSPTPAAETSDNS